MNKIDKKFVELKKNNRAAFMPFVVAGDPTYKKSLDILCKVAKYADLLEIGFPYTDPLADGKIIQDAHIRALSGGMNTKKAFGLIKRFSKIRSTPITIMTYANLVYNFGIELFYKTAKLSGVDGILIPDLPIEEAVDYINLAKKYGLNQIFLVSQNTSISRRKKILKICSGYVYLVSILGITGKKSHLNSSIIKYITRIKKETNLPLVVGFGISTKNQVKQISKAGVDGFVVGSAIVEKLSENLRNGIKFIKKLAK